MEKDQFQENESPLIPLKIQQLSPRPAAEGPIRVLCVRDPAASHPAIP